MAKNSKVERLANIFERSAGADVAGEPMQFACVKMAILIRKRTIQQQI